MKKIITGLLLASTFFLGAINIASAGYVNGYYRSNGTYVNGYYRTSPDGNPYNNYSYPGNYNPNTGSITSGNPQTYLNNYYGNSSSGYYSSPSYSYPSYVATPSCPAMSSYNSISGSCSCYSGYVVGTDILGNQSCVSADSKCTDLMGYGASYSSLTNSCGCRYGYVQSGGRCVSEVTYCTNQIGLMSQYNSLTQQCECMSGYQFNGSSCVYKQATYTQSSYCPINSHVIPGDSSSCQCDSGFQPNSTKNACVLTYTPAPITHTSSNDQICKNNYGSGSIWDGTKDYRGYLNCGCNSGLIWNTTKTSCVVSLSATPSPQSTLSPQEWCSSNNPGKVTNASIYPNGNFSCTCYSGYSSDRAIISCAKQHEN